MSSLGPQSLDSFDIKIHERRQMRSITKPRLFFDTNVCSHLLEEPYIGHYSAISEAIEQKYQMAVSPETFIELVVGLHDREGSHFHEDLAKIRVMAGTGRPVFLPFCGEFSLGKTLGIKRFAALRPVVFEKWYRLVTSTHTRAELFGMWRQEFVVEQHREGIDSYREWLKECATGGYSEFPPPERWAMNYAKSLGCDLTPEQAAKLGSKLSAAYEFRRSDFVKACDPNFKWDKKKREHDWVDGQQLLYLCDQSIHLLTNENGIKLKCAPSPQGQRVFILPEFVRDDLGIRV